jgi:integrase
VARISPGPQTKSGRDFRVALSPRAVALLRSLPGADGPRDASCVSRHKTRQSDGRNTLRIFVQTQFKRTVTVHGFRSAFKTWSAKARSPEGEWLFPRALAELALDHVIGDATELAYLRKPDGEQDEDFLEDRFPPMVAWDPRSRRPSRRSRATE